MNYAERTISDLPGYIQTTDKAVSIITLTGDPSHIGHVRIGVRTHEEVLRRNLHDQILYLVHSRNELKNPEASLEDRRRWLLMNFDHFEPELAEKIRICAWGSEKEDPYIYDLTEEYQRRLLRVAGSDKEGTIHRGNIQTTIFPRITDSSSTEVKRLMKITGSHPQLRKAMAPRVLEEILDRGIYRGRVDVRI